MCALSAQLALLELLRRFLGIDAEGCELIEYRGYLQEIVRTPLPRRADCALDHAAWHVCTADEPLGDASPRDLLRVAGYSDRELDSTSFEIEGHRFATLAFCDCPDHPRMNRLLARGESAGDCPSCGSARLDHPLHCFERIPGSLLGSVIDKAIGAIGAHSVHGVILRGALGTTLIRGPRP